MDRTTYVETIVLDNIKKLGYRSLLNNSGRLGIYVCYLWIEELKIFAFKTGKTVNITKHIISLNDKYNSNYKIILIFYGKYTNIDMKKLLSIEIEKYRIQNTKWCNLYNITIDFYEDVSIFFQNNINYYFECKNYKINKYGIQYYELSNKLLHHFNNCEIKYLENNNIPFLVLNDATIENFWKVSNDLYSKWSVDDDEFDKYCEDVDYNFIDDESDNDLFDKANVFIDDESDNVLFDKANVFVDGDSDNDLFDKANVFVDDKSNNGLSDKANIFVDDESNNNMIVDKLDTVINNINLNNYDNIINLNDELILLSLILFIHNINIIIFLFFYRL
jgi:hypothetical protein